MESASPELFAVKLPPRKCTVGGAESELVLLRSKTPTRNVSFESYVPFRAKTGGSVTTVVTDMNDMVRKLYR